MLICTQFGFEVELQNTKSEFTICQWSAMGVHLNGWFSNAGTTCNSIEQNYWHCLRKPYDRCVSFFLHFWT